MSDYKLFEVFGGLLREIAPEQIEARKADWPIHRVNCVIEVLWTPEEKAAADAEQVAAEAAAATAREEAAKTEAATKQAASDRAAATAATMEGAAAKLRAFGLDEAEIDAILRR